MDDKELQQKFDLVAAHLASLAVSQQKAEERQQRADERQQKGDERIARLERTLLLAIRAGRRERREWREHHGALIDAQMRIEARMEIGFAKLEESLARTNAAVARLAEAQMSTERKLDSLIDVVRRDRQQREDKYRDG